MQARFLINLMCTLVVGAELCTTAYAESQLSKAEKDLQQLLQWLEGEFNNYNQINFQNNDFLEEKPETDYSRLHHIRARIDAPKLDGYWLYTQINKLDRDGEIYRQSINHFFVDVNRQIKSTSYWLKNPPKTKQTPSPATLNSLQLSQLKSRMIPGCETTWQRRLDQFVGIVDHQTCIIDSKYKDEKRQIFGEEIVGKSGFWGREGGYTLDGKLAFGLEAPNYYEYHRARAMSCWVAVDDGENEPEFYRDLLTHDQGGTLSFGERKQYRLQLKQVKFPASTWSDSFELFLYRDNEEKAFAYTWTEPSGKRIAANLREVQASCKVLEEDTN